jgi:hypothetical protein
VVTLNDFRRVLILGIGARVSVPASEGGVGL